MLFITNGLLILARHAPVQAEKGPVRFRRWLAPCPCVQTQAQGKQKDTTHAHWPSSESGWPFRGGSIALTGTEHPVLRLTSASSVRGLALVNPWPATGSTKASGHYPTAGS